jgi:hypothetical protein
VLSNELVSELNSSDMPSWPKVLWAKFEELVGEEEKEEEKIRKRGVTRIINNIITF